MLQEWWEDNIQDILTLISAITYLIIHHSHSFHQPASMNNKQGSVKSRSMDMEKYSFQKVCANNTIHQVQNSAEMEMSQILVY